jgi:hypothetical protein
LKRSSSRPSKRWDPHSFLNAALALWVILCTSACTVSLAPAYRITKESHEIQFVSGQTPGLKVLASYTVENYGTGDLAGLSVQLPNKERYGVANLLIKVNGSEITPQLSAGAQTEESSMFRIPFDPAWSPTQRREITIQYAFSPTEGSNPQIALAATSFHLVSSAWFPSLQPPNHALSSSPASPVRIAYSVRIPADFLLLAPGKQSGRKKNGGEVEHRFELRKNDPAPYVVAGRYVDSSPKRSQNGVAFWTVEALKEDTAPVEEQIASALSILEKTFGSPEKSSFVPHLVESARLPATGEDEPSAIPFPGGALVNSQAMALGIDSANFAKLVLIALAHNWFGGYPSASSVIGVSEGLPEYALVVIDETRHGQTARQERVTAFLQEYDNACKEAVEKPLVSVTMRDPIEQRRIALAKAPLFYLALEDVYGEESVRRGLAQVVSILHGEEVGYQDIRAALENVTNKDFAPIFRTWLYKPGIPAEFREKYQGPAAGRN